MKIKIEIEMEANSLDDLLNMVQLNNNAKLNSETVIKEENNKKYHNTTEIIITRKKNYFSSSSSILINWLYLQILSVLDIEPVLICPKFNPTAKSAIVVSSVSPDLCEIIVA